MYTTGRVGRRDELAPIHKPTRVCNPDTHSRFNSRTVSSFLHLSTIILKKAKSKLREWLSARRHFTQYCCFFYGNNLRINADGGWQSFYFPGWFYCHEELTLIGLKKKTWEWWKVGKHLILL